ncbi:hypothetical protein Bbelb_172240 [Branchiostoma belcheri]|nr:hypothetical protein Bbelb_172240 [Branchiostoma belcheri]
MVVSCYLGGHNITGQTVPRGYLLRKQESLPTPAIHFRTGYINHGAVNSFIRLGDHLIPLTIAYPFVRVSTRVTCHPSGLHGLSRDKYGRKALMWLGNNLVAGFEKSW